MIPPFLHHPKGRDLDNLDKSPSPRGNANAWSYWRLDWIWIKQQKNLVSKRRPWPKF